MQLEQASLKDSDRRILIVTNKLDPHADIVIKELYKRKVPFARFNTEDLPLRSTISLSLDQDGFRSSFQLPYNPKVNGEHIQSVWYRRPAPYEFPESFSARTRFLAERETQAAVRGLWQNLECVWVNNPELNRIAEIKLYQLKKAVQLGFEIPNTLVTNDPKHAQDFILDNKDGTVIKTLSGGAFPDEDDPSAIFTNRVTKDKLKNIRSVKLTPTLLQRYVPKRSELRVTVVGNQSFAAEIDSQATDITKIDWRRNVLSLKHTLHSLPVDIEQKCLALVKGFGLNFGAIDLILTPNLDYVFLELNPNGQWAWIEELTGLPITDSLINLLTGH